MFAQRLIKILFVFSTALLGLVVSSNLITHNLHFFLNNSLFDVVVGWFLFFFFIFLLIISVFQD